MFFRVINLTYALGFASIAAFCLIGGPLDRLYGSALLMLSALWTFSATQLIRGQIWGLWVSLVFLIGGAALSIHMLSSGIGLLPKAGDPTDGIGYMIILGAMGLLATVPVMIGLVLQHHTLRNSVQNAQPLRPANGG